MVHYTYYIVVYLLFILNVHILLIETIVFCLYYMHTVSSTIECTVSEFLYLSRHM